MTEAAVPRLPRRIPYVSLAAILLVVVMTLGNAIANVLPHHVPTARERQRAEQADTASARRARITWLLASGDHCDKQLARELARALVFDGRPATAYTDDFTRRCGVDPVVDRWRAASALLR